MTRLMAAVAAGPSAIKLAALIAPLSLDTFAVSAAMGTSHLARRQQVRLSLVFAAFEAGMPLIGLALGAPLSEAIGGIADYLAIGLLIALGAFIVVEGADDDELLRLPERHGLAVLALGVSVSLDELAIGFTLGLLRAPVVLVIAVIAAQAFVAAQLGLRFGARLGERMREGAERLAGAILVALGIALLVEKLLG